MEVKERVLGRYAFRAVAYEDGLYGIVSMKGKRNLKSQILKYVDSICCFFQQSEGSLFVDTRNLFFYGNERNLEKMYNRRASEAIGRDLKEFVDGEHVKYKPEGSKSENPLLIRLDELRLQEGQKELVSDLVPGAVYWLSALDPKQTLEELTPEENGFRQFIPKSPFFPAQLWREAYEQKKLFTDGTSEFPLSKLSEKYTKRLDISQKLLFNFPEWTKRYGGLT